jgi:hypothetical protein
MFVGGEWKQESRRIERCVGRRTGGSEDRMNVAYGLNLSRVCLLRMIRMQIHFLASQGSLIASSASPGPLRDTGSLLPSLAATVLQQWVAQADSGMLSQV